MIQRVLFVVLVAAFMPRVAVFGQRLIDETVAVQQVVSDSAFTEGPVVDRQGSLFFSDGPNDRIMRLSADGQLTEWLKPCGAANGLMFDLQGRLLMCQSSRSGGGRALAVVARDIKTDSASSSEPRRIEILSDQYRGSKYIAPNDLCTSSSGNIYFTDPYYHGEKSQPNSGVYCRDPKGQVTLQIDNLQKPNGITITPDDQWVYISDRGTQKLHRYRVDPNSSLIHDKILYDFSPDRGIDGMWLDVQGNIYGAAGEGKTTGLFVISPEGKLLLHKPLPEFSTNVTFGGEDMRDIYVTASTSVYKLRATIPGMPHHYARSAKDQIQRIIDKQSAAWNASDIDTFMKYYWRSEQLTFSSGGSTRRGWNATRDRYKKTYPNPETMGRVTFTELEVSELASDVALVLGRWQLDREVGEDIGGNFSLVFRRIDGLWLIIHDHSSQLMPE